MPKKGFYGAKNGFEGLVYRVEREGKFDFMAKWVRHDYEQLKYNDTKSTHSLIEDVR